MNKMILNVVGNGVWHEYDAITQNTISDVIAKYGVVHVTVQTCGRAKQVCKSWDNALNACDPCIKLTCFQPLFVPMFQRFVRFVSQIDMTRALKVMTVFDMNGQGTPANCPQETYEQTMFSLSLSRAMSGYKESLASLCYSCPNSWDMNYLVAASETLCTDFYNEVLMPKCLDISQAQMVPTDHIENEFFSMPIGVLLKRIEELEENGPLLIVYKRLVGKILIHSLLPIEPKNPVLNGKEAALDWRDTVLMIGSIGSLMVLLYVALQSLGLL